MTDDSLHSRRRFLGAAAGTATMAATAGCLGSVLSASNAVEPEQPTEPREGTPGEFYYFLEANDIEVDRLAEDDDELFLTYRSDAETVEESDDEIVVIYEIYKQALIHRGSEITFLYTEIANPFEGQALGWGINSEWVHRFDSPDEDADADEDPEDVEGNESVETEPAGDDSEGNETDGNETDETDNALDMNQITLWSNIMNTKVYQEDVDAVGADNETDATNATNATIADNASATDTGTESETEGDD
ncbi:hypothetical protein OB955_16370 [Halobacteria archaeon AArc-m2/3/4]|uniref:DUF8159 domain-containing protein n=1 Tax=Natronoglomus mannanivorans TaxID=2979990 RepID=A0ABT2QHB0_9EURY|nr:hypothetical protein [Halobacteria archaeon AArc-m2/3/4]